MQIEKESIANCVFILAKKIIQRSERKEKRIFTCASAFSSGSGPEFSPSPTAGPKLAQMTPPPEVYYSIGQPQKTTHLFSSHQSQFFFLQTQAQSSSAAR